MQQVRLNFWRHVPTPLMEYAEEVKHSVQCPKMSSTVELTRTNKLSHDF